MDDTKKSRIAHIELHTAVFLFGISGLFGKLISASPITIVIGRTAFAAMAIFIGSRLFSIKLGVAPGKSRYILPLSGLVLALHWVAFFHAIQISTVAIGLIGFATFPVFVTFLEPLVSREKIRAVDVASALIVMVGLILVAPSFDLSNRGTIGLIWSVVSGGLFAVLTLLNRYLVKPNSFIVVAFYQHSTAAIVLVPFGFLLSEFPGSNTIWLLLVLGVFCTAIPQTLFIKSLTALKAQLASIVAGLEPVYGIILAAILLEIPGLSTVIGAILVFAAVVLAIKVHPVSGGNVEKEVEQS